MFSRVIDPEPDIAIVAMASTAEEALAMLEEIETDVILLDLEMPGRGGLDAMPDFIARAPAARILVVSTLTKAGAEATLCAMALGAADTLEKPQPGCFDSGYRQCLVERVRALGQSAAERSAPMPAPKPAPAGFPDRKQPHVLAIGASTGGIHAAGAFFAALPRRIGIPILITQHLPASFMEPFAGQLKKLAHRTARVAQDGSVLVPDEIFVAPGHAHVTIIERRSRLEVRLDDSRAPSGCRPSVDPMLESLAASLDGHAMAVILSGMGRDGVLGAAALHAAGGTLYAQDAVTSAVWGMPGAVAEAGLAAQVLPPEQIALRIPIAAGAA